MAERISIREAAIARALQLEQDGADILDIGGESTRPGAAPVTAEEELRRILPVIQVLRGKLRIPMSVDTRRAEVAEAALAAGAEILNDVSGLRMDPRLGEVARRGTRSADPHAHAGNAANNAARTFRARRHPRRDDRACARQWRAQGARASQNRNSCSIRESDLEKSTNRISKFSRGFPSSRASAARS